MITNLYAISALGYALVLVLILISDLRTKIRRSGSERSFRMLLVWVIFFCLQDMVWGLCAAHVIPGENVFFGSSTVFHISTVLTTFFWLNFVLSYLEKYIKHRYRYLVLDFGVIVFELAILLWNLFEPVMFRIEEGIYVTKALRPLTFVNQYIVYFLIGVITLILAVREKGKEHETFLTVFYFSLAPILMGVFQLLFPDAPFYSLGYFLGCFIVHLFLVVRDREKEEKNEMLHSIANTYYSMHLIDLETDTMERMIESEILTRLIGDANRPQEMINRSFRGTVSEEYQEIVMPFVDLTDISERLKDRTSISCEFVGKNYGWTRITFVSVEKQDDVQKKIMLVTQIIDAEKKSEIELLFRSNNDELTGLYNRRAYAEEMSKHRDEELEEDLVLVAMDVNELKIINDTLGHEAGDELLTGATDCMKKCFSSFGKIYRTGGDEFNAILYASDRQLEEIKQDFEETVLRWSGTLVRELSVSCGYVRITEVSDRDFHAMARLADERMYAAKAEYYQKKGVDRRGQRDAHTALCALYTKILKINLTDDSYQIVNMLEEEQAREKGFSNKISVWLSDFGRSGQVHPDDLDYYLAQTDLDYLKGYFKDKSSLNLFYRRMIGTEYKQVMLEIIPAGDYSEKNQSLFLYVKNIDK